MVALSPFFRAKAHECITDILCAALAQSEVGTIGNAAQVFPASLLDIIAALPSVVHEACAEFKEQWNAANPDPMLRLPVELMAACFQPLGTRERFAVSHVSRAWRRICLAEKSLWTAAFVSSRALHSKEMLAALFSRSHPMPFQLTWHSAGIVDDDILDLVLQNIGRVRSIATKFVSSRLFPRIFDHPAPVLRSLILEDSPYLDPCVLPTSWGGSRSPLLQNIVVGHFSVPDTFEPLPSVLKFHGYPAHFRSMAPNSRLHHLFDIFPRLVSLNLSNVTEEDLSRLPDVPQSLHHITFSSAYDHIDYSRFIANRLHGRSIELSVDSAGAIAKTIDAFATTVRGTWSMILVEHDTTVSLESTAGDQLLRLHTYQMTWWMPERQGLPKFDGLAMLTLALEHLIDLYSIQDWHRTLPHLTALTVTAQRKDDLGYLRGCDEWVVSPPIIAAQLERLALEAPRVSVAAYIAAFLVALPLLISYGRARLDAVEIETEYTEAIREEDLCALALLAHCVRIKDSSTNRIVFDTFDDVSN